MVSRVNHCATFFCHCEPLALCHSERSEESPHIAQDKLREAIYPIILHRDCFGVLPLAMT